MILSVVIGSERHFRLVRVSSLPSKTEIIARRGFRYTQRSWMWQS